MFSPCALEIGQLEREGLNLYELEHNQIIYFITRLECLIF